MMITRMITSMTKITVWTARCTMTTRRRLLLGINFSSLYLAGEFSSSIKMGKDCEYFPLFSVKLPLLMNKYEFPRDIICYGLYIEMVTIIKGESCVSISVYEDKDRTLYIMYVLLTVASDHTLTSIVYLRRVSFKYFHQNTEIILFSPFNIGRKYLNLFKIDSF